jgi:RNA-directed DNA polymerase
VKEETTNPPGGVPATAARPGEARPLWGWVERSVWTDRMLDALERGVQGGKWHSLIDKVYAPKNLEAAFRRVRRNRGAPGVDRVTIGQFEGQKERNLADLHESLRSGLYRPGDIRRKHIPKKGKPGETRPLGVPGVRDRVVQTALRNVLEPICEKTFAERSFGFRPKRGQKDALRIVQRLLNEGYTFVVDADLKGYFDTIPHDLLMAEVEKLIADRKVLGLIKAFLMQPVLDDGARTVPGEGTPQGAVISPLLSNLYLSPLDHLMAREGFEMVRYADDFVILCKSAAEAQRALETVRGWTAGAGLKLHPEKTRLVSLGDGGHFDFLGYRFHQRGRDVAPKSGTSFRDRIRELTPRGSGASMQRIVQTVNRTVRGWFEYFKHARAAGLQRFDQFVRQRLRSILWRRSKRRGMPSELANRLWQLPFFADLGLVSIMEARVKAIRSARAVKL